MFFYEAIIIALMLGFNALFACYEMALASISRSRLSVLLNENKKGAVAAVFMKDNMEQSLAVIQLGITLFSAIAAAVGGAGVEEKFSPFLIKVLGLSAGFANFIAIIALIIPLTAVTMVFAELFPKMFALYNKEKVLLKFSPAFKALTGFLYPLTSVLENLVKKMILMTGVARETGPGQHSSLHELHAAAGLARQAKIMGAQAEKIVLAAAALSTRMIKEIIIPIGDVSMISSKMTLTEALLKAHTDMHTRFPVCAESNDPQTIEGYVNFKDIIMALKNNPTNPSIKGIARPIKKINENTLISQLLEKMVQEKTHIIITTGEAGKVTGLITLEDILEELVGDIDNVYERLPSHVYSYESSWIVGGSASMRRICEITGICWQDTCDVIDCTLADWWQKQTAGEPRESITAGGYTILARKFKRKKLAEAIITKK
jgi:putative hemolysin